ncbi:hypothetical protein C8R44DRAFT_391931 [Mycena epipterygia]|nr:hypothetical protein C8R44DRAFT_391931 [Mycena epipterygia]
MPSPAWFRIGDDHGPANTLHPSRSFKCSPVSVCSICSSALFVLSLAFLSRFIQRPLSRLYFHITILPLYLYIHNSYSFVRTNIFSPSFPVRTIVGWKEIYVGFESEPWVDGSECDDSYIVAT